MEFTSEQTSRIKALLVIGTPYKIITRRFDCQLHDIKQAVKDYPLEMTEEEALRLLLG